MTDFKCINTTWKQMNKYAENAAYKIKKEKYILDMIVALSRGGLVPARMLCDMLHVKNCISMKIDHWGITATKDGEAKITQGLNVDLKDKNVLIVDDITDTGKSMLLAIDHVKMLNPKNVKTVTLLYLTHSTYKPDFYGKKLKEGWFVFPWNFKEDMVNLISKIDNFKSKNIGEIREELKQKFELELKEKDLDGIIEHINYVQDQLK